MLGFPLELHAFEAGCADLRRPATGELTGVAALSFLISALLAALVSLVPFSERLANLPVSQRWRVRATFASLQQPLAMMFLMPPSEAFRILTTSQNPWMMTAPRHLWFALFYLFGAWAFEVLVLLHPSTGARRAWGTKGWWVQVVHHVGFPTLSLHNLFSGCAVPGVAIACCTELTVLFSSTYWLLKLFGFAESVLQPIKACMQLSTYILRGAFVILLDVYALANDQSKVPMMSWFIQLLALISTNALNFMILRLVQGAVNREKKNDKPSLAGHATGLVESSVGLMVRLALWPLGKDAADNLLRSILYELCAATDVRIAFRSGWPGLDKDAASPAISRSGSFVNLVARQAEASSSSQNVGGVGRGPSMPSTRPDGSDMLGIIQTIASECAGFHVDVDKPLLDSGMDSKAAVLFSSQLASQLPTVPLPSTVVFDYPTLSAVAGYASSQHAAVEAPAFSGGATGPAAEPVAVVGAACGLPGGSGTASQFLAHLIRGTDGVVEVPFARWDLEEYHDPNPDALGKMYPRHGAFIEGAETFGATFFGISAPEARAMDPQQRQVLEVSYASFYDSGCEKEVLLGREVAVTVGQANNDWIQVQSGDMRKINPYTATGTSASIAAARVSYVLGLKGPSYVVDTACSSALVAMDGSVMNLRRHRCTSAVSAASNIMASVATYVSFSKPRMLSPLGRSLTFDASANGYGRGEGTGAFVVELPTNVTAPVQGLIRGIAVNQDGLSSTMTAPNGPSQQTVMALALREAGLTPSEVAQSECHGTGTPLGDPIEVGALQAVHAARRGSFPPLVFTAVKSNLGHLEGAAASPGFLKTLAALQVSSSSATLHFRSMNPHISLDTEKPQVFASEHSLLKGRTECGGLSSFGFGGTNAHAAVGGVDIKYPGHRALPVYSRKAFLWREAGYRLLRRSPQEGVFEVAITADLYDVVRHHVVFGSIVVPGVVYVEMALEATRKLFGPTAHLADVTMVFPFVVPERLTGSEPQSTMRFVQRGESRFEIQSVTASGKVTQHVEARIERGGVVPETLNADLPSLRARVDEPVDPAVVYEAINSVGLYLGPMFQVAKQVWRTETKGTSEVLAKLELDPRVPNLGYIMHPALFDGTIHILATASIGKNVTGLKIFGGVGRVNVVREDNFSRADEFWVHLVVTETSESSQTFNIKVLSTDGGVLMTMDDIVFRGVKPEQIQLAIAAQGATEDDQRLYEVHWADSQPSADSSQGPKEAAAAPAPESPNQWLLLGDDEAFLKELRSELGGDCILSGLHPPAEHKDLSPYSKVLLNLSPLGCTASIDALDVLLQLLKAIAIAGDAAPELWVVTCSTQEVVAGDLRGVGLPLHAGLWGLMRTFRNECPLARSFCIDLTETSSQTVCSLANEVRRVAAAGPAAVLEPELGLRPSGEVRVPRLVDVTNQLPAEPGTKFAKQATYVITGGTGALGVMVAAWMADKEAGRLILLSRSGKPPADTKAALKKLLAGAVHVRKGDISSPSSVMDIIKTEQRGDFPVRGVVHAAGVLCDHMITDLERDHLTAVLATKVDGTLNLHKAAADCVLDVFALFSSVAATLGSVGQGNYSAANAFMDSFAAYRRSNGQPGLSLQWGPWADVGMAARAGTSESSIPRLNGDKALKAFDILLGAEAKLHSGIVGIARINWKVLLGQLPRVPLFLSSFSSAAPTGNTGALSNVTQDDIRNLVVSSLQDALGSDDFDLSTPLMELGLDSLAGVEFRNRLQGSLDGLQLSSTLMFDYPTVPDLVDYIWSQVGPSDEADTLAGAITGADLDEQLAIIAHSGRFPGSLTNHPGELWRTLRCGRDTTSELPPERWDIDAFFDADPDVPGKTYVKLGHFIPGIEQFDGEFFGLGEAEQRGMDPHQWLTLEITYDCLHAAGLSKENMSGMDCGVYVGCATLGGIEPDIPAFGPFTNIGYAYSGLSGRVSHALSLRGPCFTVDTACSSTIVALDCGSQALRLGRCKSSVASGVNLQLSAAIWVGFSKMRGLAHDGNCKTFDARADGFARGEGLGAAFVQRASSCGQEQRPAALLAGVATNHDGRAATITAPNGTAQQRVLRAALSERSTTPEAVACLECHGTGTALGDPIEVGAQRVVYGKGRPGDLPLVLAAVKTNLGHLEGSAGVAGLSKVILVLQRSMVPSSLWLEKLNPNIDISGFNVLIPCELLDWRAAVHRASVSSFGFSGTNGHAVLQQQQQSSSSAALRRKSKSKSKSDSDDAEAEKEAASSSSSSCAAALWPRQAYRRRILKQYREWLQPMVYLEDWTPQEPSPRPQPMQGAKYLMLGAGPMTSSLHSVLPASKTMAFDKSQSSADLAKDLQQVEATAVILTSPAELGETEIPGNRLLEVLRLLQALQLVQKPAPGLVLVVTAGAQSSDSQKFDSSSSIWGLLRSARLELPHITFKLVDVEVSGTPEVRSQHVVEALTGPENELEFAWVGGRVCAPRLRQSKEVASALHRCDAMFDADLLRGGSALVTGGTGGLGLLAAQQLAELGAEVVTLASRRGIVSAGSTSALFQRLEAYPSTSFRLRACNVEEPEEVAQLVSSCSASASTTTLVHAAGVLDRCPLGELDQERISRTIKPKVAGAWYLGQCTEATPIRQFVLFSSVSAVLGLSGGAAYSAANATLDALACWRRARDLTAVSVRFGPVSEVGMTAAAGGDTHLERMPLKAITANQTASVLRLLLARPMPSSPLKGNFMLARADWATLRAELPVRVPQLANFTTSDSKEMERLETGSSWARMPPHERKDEVLRLLRTTASGMSIDLEQDTPLMEAGIDSLSAVEFRSRVAREFGQLRLPSTLMFDYPSLQALSTHIVEQLEPQAAARAPEAPLPIKLLGPMSQRSGHETVEGVGCTLPGAGHCLQALLSALLGGCDGLAEMPFARWDVEEYYNAASLTGSEMYVRHAGFIDGAELFDNIQFNIKPSEAEAMDPQQRHLLETAQKAFCDAGLQRSCLTNSATGVFVGQDKCDWSRMLTAAHAGPFAATGGSASISSNRISYVFGTCGPSCTLDTACSSSLVAADMAVMTMRRGRCEVSAVCGVNMLLLPQTFIACCQAHMLSQDGRCHTFDQSASGYARGEGCGANVLGGKRSRVSLADMAGTAVNQDGRGANLTSPVGPAQRRVIREALAEAKVEPQQLNVSETHGTGTALGDPIEMGALTQVSSGQARDSALLVGAVKTNIGHLEGGAGMAGLLKLTFILQQKLAPPNLHLHSLNEHLLAPNFPHHFPTEPERLAQHGQTVASVSSFGFGGTNGHVVLQAPCTREVSEQPRPKRVAFLFTGQGSQYAGMGKVLFQTEPVYRRALERCAKVLDSHMPIPLLELLHEDSREEALNETQFSQPAIFCLQYALTELWQSRGVQPCAVLGYSFGEYAAAVAAGTMALEDALKLIAARGQAIAKYCEAGAGSMVALLASEADVRAAITSAGATGKAAVAAVNGPKIVIVSGATEAVEAVAAHTGSTRQRLKVSHAFHSPLMAPALPSFHSDATTIQLNSPKVRFFSTLLGKEAAGELAKPQYWVDQISGAVQFLAALSSLDSAVHPDAYLEIGSTPTLIRLGKKFLAPRGPDLPAWIPSLDAKAKGDLEVVMQRAEAAVSAEPQRPKATFNRQPFPWRQAGHPLLRRKSTRSDGATVYSSPIDGHVLELLSHHIVHGEVVVPGACYLEMIVAGVRDHLGLQSAWQLESLGFAKPLVLRLEGGLLEEPIELRLLIWPDGRLEVESQVGADEEDSITTTHVEASLLRDAGGWTASPPPGDVRQLGDLRSRCPSNVGIDLMYSFGVKAGLPLQRRFRAVRQVQTGDLCGLARLEMERDGTHVGFLLGPSVIDSSFQALMSLADPDVGIGSLKIPLSIKRLQPTGRPFSIAVWSYFELIDVTEHSSVFRSWLMNDAGETVLYFDRVHLQEVRDEHLQQVLRASGRADTEQQALYTSHWHALDEATEEPERPEAGEEKSQTDGSSSLLLLASPDLELEVPPDCRVVVHGRDVDLMDENALCSMSAGVRWQKVIFAPGLSAVADVDVLAMALHILRAISSSLGSPPPLWLLTRGAQPLAVEGEDARRHCCVTHSGLWGFARAARVEDPERFDVRCLDLDPLEGIGPWNVLFQHLQATAGSGEVEVAVRAGRLSTPRLERAALPVLAPCRLNLPARGSLADLRPVPQARRPPAPPGFALLRTRAVGLNFRDILNVMGLYPGDPGPPGADCAGTVLELGDHVEHLSLADEVFGEAPGCLSTYSLGPGPLLAQKPATWSFEEAATMPVIFVTVEESLGDLAHLKQGERVLIHAAAGGVGLVAIQYAMHVGAEVFATAGAEEKQSYLRSLGVKYITTSRNGKQFDDDMRSFLKESNAEGIDVVLNSLSHDDYIPRSLALLRQGGRFIEIGKRGIWTHSQMREQRPDIMYEKIAADTMMECQPWRYNGYLKRLLTRVEEGALKPIHMHTFTEFENGVAAMQFLQRAQNIGKVIISIPSRGLCSPGASAVLSGGTGALGVVSARFLAEEGLRRLLLLSRRAQPGVEMQTHWNWLQQSTVEVQVQKCDVADEKSVLALIDQVKGKLGCLLHLAGALADGMLPSLSRDSFQQSYGPKVHGLHHLCQLPFEAGAAMLLFSSTSSLFGSPGQANYSAANSVLDALAPYWAATGTRARSVQWGPWAEVGMAVEKGTVQRAKASGLGALTNTQGMTILGSVLLGSESLVGAAHIRWPKFLRTLYRTVPPFLAHLAAEAKRTSAEAEEGAGETDCSHLTAMAPEERYATVRDTIHGFAKEVVNIDDLALDAPLLESGMDSLSGVEFRNRLLKGFGGVRIPNSAVFDYPTVGSLAAFVDAQIGGSASSTSVPRDQPRNDNSGAGHTELDGPRIVAPLNDRTVGTPVFLVPGAGMQAAGFRALAELLPVPAYGISWPKDSIPRSSWPSTLAELAARLLEEIRRISPSSPLQLIGHSFGATVCLEMTRLAEERGDHVGLLIVLDPRSLPPTQVNLGPVFENMGLSGSLALLSHSTADGTQYSKPLEELMQAEASEHEGILQRLLSPAALAVLEHVHVTSQWYASLLGAASSEPQPDAKLRCRVVWLCGAETWLQESSSSETQAEALVREFEGRLFQNNTEVAGRISAQCGGTPVLPIHVPGGHFAMLHEPHVAKVALRLCHALVEAGAAEA